MIFPGQLGQGVSGRRLPAHPRRLHRHAAAPGVRPAGRRERPLPRAVRRRAHAAGAVVERPRPGDDRLLVGLAGRLERARVAPARQALAQKGASLARAFNGAATSFASMRANDDDEIDANVANVNAITAQIDKLNQQIGDAVLAGAQIDPTTKAIVKPGQAPNDLLDQRDKLLDDLSKIADITNVSVDDEQRATVVVAGKTLVTRDAGDDRADARADVDTAVHERRAHARHAVRPRGRLHEHPEPGERDLVRRAARHARDVAPRRGQRAARARLRPERHRGRPLLRLHVADGPARRRHALTMSTHDPRRPDDDRRRDERRRAPARPATRSRSSALQKAATTAGATFDDYYNGLQSALGTAAQDSKRSSDANDIVVNSLTDRRAADLRRLARRGDVEHDPLPAGVRRRGAHACRR